MISGERDNAEVLDGVLNEAFVNVPPPDGEDAPKKLPTALPALLIASMIPLMVL
jgi:hypothetical protein